MPVLKLVCLVVFGLLLVATPAYLLKTKEWKKLVSAFFTGTKLTDGNGRFLIQGEILNILASNTNDWQIRKHDKRHPIHRQYFPRLTASFGECSDGSIKHVSFSSGKGHKSHAENKVVRKISSDNHDVHSIVISFSPCDCCADKIIERLNVYHPRPIVYICWVHQHPKSSDGFQHIRALIRHGFDVKVWDTKKVLNYLLEHAPSAEVRDKLLEAYESASDAIFKRDMETQRVIELITSGSDENDQTDEDDEEAYWYGWNNYSRRHDEDDDDNEPGPGGATGGTGGGGTCCNCFSSSSEKKAFSSSSSMGFGASTRYSWSCNHYLAGVLALVGLLVSSYKPLKVSTNCKYHCTNMLSSVVAISLPCTLEI